MNDRPPITQADIEARFRQVQDQFDVVAADGKKKLTAVGAVGAVVLLLVVYVAGRRAGRKRSTVLEIRRL
jgi:hypothetical protein